MTDVFALEADSAAAAPWRQTAHEYARDTLRRAILNGTLPGGTRLVQSDIANRLGVSTTPVREALRQLAADGLVVFDAHVGALVRRLDQEELVEVYDLLRALTPLAMERASQHITPEELDRAREYYRQMQDTELDSTAWVKLNIEFHSVLERASRATTLSSMLKNLHEAAAIHVIRSLEKSPGRRISGNHEHEEIIAALSQGDGARATEFMLLHLNSTLEILLEAFETDSSAR